MIDFRRSQADTAFTLIELLVVIAVIAILASLVLATSGYVQEKGARSRAEAEIAALSAALESYNVDRGSYPTNSGASTNNNILIAQLMPTNAGSKVYFEFPTNMIPRVTGRPQLVLDPFGRPYNYQFPGATNRSGTNFFDLWTTGKKANDPEASWIKNW